MVHNGHIISTIASWLLQGPPCKNIYNVVASCKPTMPHFPPVINICSVYIKHKIRNKIQHSRNRALNGIQRWRNRLLNSYDCSTDFFVLVEIDLSLFNLLKPYNIWGLKTVIKTLWDSHRSYQTSYALDIYLLGIWPITHYTSRSYILVIWFALKNAVKCGYALRYDPMRSNPYAGDLYGVFWERLFKNIF